MVPPGVHTFSGMKISSIHLATSLATNQTSPPWSEKCTLSTQLEAIFSDHAYVLKSEGTGAEDGTTWSNGHNESSTGASDDDVFYNRMVGLHNITESGSVDFLKGLDELDFDLDPDDDDVEMADSLQDFIDSALGESNDSSLSDRWTGGPSQQPHQDIEDKKEFLSSLCLRSAQFKASNSDLRSSPYERVSDNPWSVLTADQDTQLSDLVPTKRCSCVASEAIPKVVYSTAQVGQPVCTSPSTMATNSKDTACRNCLQGRLTSGRPMSPLFIDTSFSECPQSIQSSSGNSVSTSSVTTDDTAFSDNEVTDVMKWLTESSQQSENLYTDPLHGEGDNKLSVLSENSSYSLNLESFVDLDEYLDDDSSQQITPLCPCDHSPLPLAMRDALIMSPLRFSLLEEQQVHKRCSSFGFKTHLSMCSNISHDSRTSESSNMSPCDSPAWSVTDSSQLSPLGSMNLSGPTAPENIFENSSLKGQLALLKLFSEDNVESLLLAESSVPTIRFV